MTSGRKRVLFTLIVIGVLSSCAPPPRRGDGESPGLPAVAESYVRLALKLAQHDPELVESWRGPAGWKPGPRQPVAALLSELETLQREVAATTSDASSRDRIAYLAAQLQALHLSAERLLGRSTSFAAEAQAALGIAPAPIDRAALDHARSALDLELPGHGRLADRYAAFKRRLVIPPARIESVMHAALDLCRTATRQAVTLPPDERIDLVFDSASPWDGYARYLGGHRTRIEINPDAALDVTRALRLACHEGYPGHHVQYLWIDDELVGRRNWREFELTPGFGRHLLVAEGAAEAGADLVFPDERRVAAYRDTLLPAAGLSASEAPRIVRVETLVAALEPAIGDIVAQYLDNSLTQAAAVDRLRDDALTANPESLLAFAERRRTRVLVYPLGRALVRHAIGDGGVAGLRRVFVDQPFAVQ